MEICKLSRDLVWANVDIVVKNGRVILNFVTMNVKTVIKRELRKIDIKSSILC